MKSHVAFSSAAFCRPSLQRMGLLTAAAAAVLLTGCASSRLPPAPTLAATESYNYLIGPGDTVNIIVWRNPELSISVPVRPDGKISTPLVEDLPAIGRDSTSLARDIERELSKMIREPVVTVIVSGFVGPYSQQIRVVGEAARPQALPYVQQMTLLDVMIAVGGLTEYAAGNRATILRVPPAVKATSDAGDVEGEDDVSGESLPEDSAPAGDEAVPGATVAADAHTETASPVAPPTRLAAATVTPAAPASTDVKTVVDENMTDPVAAAASATTPEAHQHATAPAAESEENGKADASSTGTEDEVVADADKPAAQAMPKPQQYRVRLNDLIKEGDVSANVEMLPGDILIIPQSWF